MRLPGSKATRRTPVILAAIVALVVAARAAPPVEPQRDWGQDVLIGRTGTVPSLGKLVTDADTNGDIYIGVLDPGPGFEDTVTVWRATDGGVTWQQWYRYRGDPLRGGILDCELRVCHDAGGALLCDVAVFEGPDSMGGLWIARHRPTSSEVSWAQVVAGDSILRVTADRNTESPEHLFVAWETRGGRVAVADWNDTIVTLRTAFTDCERLALCAGGDGCVYVAANSRDSAWVSVKRYAGNLTDSDTAVAKLDSSADRRVWDVSIAADRETPCSTQTAIALYRHRDTLGRVSPHFGWATSGGNDWQYSFWPVTNQNRTTWDARFPHVRRTYDDELIRAVVTMHEPSRNWDTVVYAYARAEAPALWEQRAARNEFRASDEFGAKVGFSWTSMGGYVTYSQFGSRDVYFDGYGLVGTEDAPVGRQHPPGGATVIRGRELVLHLGTAAGRPRVRLTDCLGRVVWTGAPNLDQNGRVLVPVGDLPAGVYLAVPDGQPVAPCGRFVLLR